MNKKLKYGETPWDGFSKAELLREVQRMYSALISAQSVLKMQEATDELSTYWGKTGVGGGTREMIRQIIEPLHKAHTSEAIWRAFFRYADDLLFDTSTGYRMIGCDWTVCPKCGVMLGRGKEDLVGKPHSDIIYKDCDGIMERLDWKHLKH